MTILLALALLFAQDGAQIADLIKKLGSDDFEQRQKADEELRKIGKAVIPQLEEAAKSKDLEVASRAKAILRALKGGAKASNTIRLTIESDRIELRIGEKVYKADSAEEFRKNYPELYDRYVRGVLETDSSDDEFDRHFAELHRMLEELRNKFFRFEDEDEWKELFERWANQQKILEEWREKLKGWKPSGDAAKEDPEAPKTGPRIGIILGPVDDELGKKLKLREDEGVEVVKVYDGSIAKKVGLAEKDIILKINGKTISNALQARAQFWKALESEEIELQIVRERQPKTLKVKSADVR